MIRSRSDFENDDEDGEEEEEESDLDSDDIEALLDCSSVEYSSYEKESWESSYSREYDRRRAEEDERRENVIEGEESFEEWLADKEEEWDKIDSQKTIERIKRKRIEKEKDAEKPDWPWCIPLRNKAKIIVAYSKCAERHYKPVMQWKWSKSGGYAKGTIDGRNRSMHDYIMVDLEGRDIPEGCVIDHMPPKNDRLDNRIDRLRIITRGKNIINRKKTTIPTTSKYIGVSKKNGKWSVNVIISDDIHSLGTYDTEEEAARTRDVYLLHLFPDDNERMQPLNFPEKIEEMRLMKPYERKQKYRNTYWGVSWLTSKSLHVATLTVNGKRILWYSSKSEEICAKRYDATIVKHKLDRPLNFPDDYPDYVPNVNVIEKRDIPNTDTCYLLIKNRSKGLPIIDIADYERVKFGNIKVKSRNYVHIKIEKKMYLLHRFLKNAKSTDPRVDHRDRNPLNNTQANIQFSTPKENSENRSKAKNATSTYFGVSKDKRTGKYYAQIVSGTLHKNIRYADEIDASRARDLLAMTYCAGSRHPKNYNDWTPEVEAEWRKKLKIPKLNEEQ